MLNRQVEQRILNKGIKKITATTASYGLPQQFGLTNILVSTYFQDFATGRSELVAIISSMRRHKYSACITVPNSRNFSSMGKLRQQFPVEMNQKGLRTLIKFHENRRYFSFSSQQFGSLVPEVPLEQRQRCAVALRNIMEMRSRYPSGSYEVGRWNDYRESLKLQLAVEKMRRNYSLDLLSTSINSQPKAMGTSTSSETYSELECVGAERIKNEMMTSGYDELNGRDNSYDSIANRDVEDLKGTVFDLRKRERPEPPEGTVLSFYGSSASKIKLFAKSFGLPTAGTKYAVYKRILEGLRLASDKLFILNEDTIRSNYVVKELWLDATRIHDEEEESSLQTEPDQDRNSCSKNADTRLQRPTTSTQPIAGNNADLFHISSTNEPSEGLTVKEHEKSSLTDMRKTSSLSPSASSRNVSSNTAKTKYSLKIQYPAEAVPDAQYPISHFVYISTIDEAEAVLAFLSDHTLEWGHRKKEKGFSQAMDGHDSQITIDQTCFSRRASADGEGFNTIHPAFHGTRLETPAKLNVIGVDVETTGLDPYTSHLRLITLSSPPYPTFIFDVKKLWGWDELCILPNFCDIITEGDETYKVVSPYFSGGAYQQPVASRISSSEITESAQADAAISTSHNLSETERQTTDMSNFTIGENNVSQTNVLTSENPSVTSTTINTALKKNEWQCSAPLNDTLKSVLSSSELPKSDLSKPESLVAQGDQHVAIVRNGFELTDTQRNVLLTLWRKIKSILEDSSITKVFFNGKFDYKFLRVHFGTCVSNPIKDTMLDSYLLEAGLHPSSCRYGLNDVVEQYLNFELPLPKSIPQNNPNTWKYENLGNDQLLYAARDAAVLPYLAKRLTTSIALNGLVNVSFLESRCMRGVAEIELNGMKLNRKKYEEIKKEIEEQRIKDGERLQKVLGWTDQQKNINSPRQVLQALQDLEIRIPVEYSSFEVKEQVIGNIEVQNPPLFFKHRQANRSLETSGLTNPPKQLLSSQLNERFDYLEPITQQTLTRATSATAVITNTDMKTLKNVDGSNAVDALLRYRKSKKLESAFTNAMQGWVNCVTGRVHPQLNQTGTSSGRFSCCSPNLQQVPRDSRFRDCFVASSSRHKLVIADLSQIELRIAADIAPDFLMIEAFNQNHDLHRLTASLLKGVPMDQITKRDRQMAKAVNFGLIYGISARGLKEYAKCSYGVDMSLDEASLWRARYFENYKGIAQWHRQVKNRTKSEASQIYEVGEWIDETRTRSYRRALFSRAHGQFQKLLNYPIQGTAADMIKNSVAVLIDKLHKVSGKLLHCVHDEIIVEVPADRAQESKELVINIMEESGNKFLKHVKCVAEGNVGNSWSDKP